MNKNRRRAVRQLGGVGSYVLFGVIPDGATAQTPKCSDMAEGWVSVRGFGAKGDGATDDTLAMQAAHNTGRPVYYPPGNYLFSTLRFASGGIIGSGLATMTGFLGGTVLQSKDKTSADLITYVGSSASAAAPIFRDFSLMALPNTKAQGIGIHFDPPGTTGDALHFVTVDNVMIRYVPICIKFDNCDSFTISRCQLFFYLQCGIALSNDKHPDVGDSSIYGCQFFNGNAGEFGRRGFGVYQQNSGGLKITGNKFNGGASAYVLDLATTTSDLLFTGNSVENASGEALSFNNQVNSPGEPVRFQNICISGNQFSGNAKDIFFNEIPNYFNSSYWDNVSITGNTFYYTNPMESSVTIKAARKFIVSGNAFSGNGRGRRAILVDATASNGLIGKNKYSNFIENSLINNSATTQVDYDLEKGAAMIRVSNTANYGLLFSATGHVNFVVPFENTPTVRTQALGEVGALGVVVQRVSEHGFDYRGIAVTAGALVDFEWDATGVQRDI